MFARRRLWLRPRASAGWSVTHRCADPARGAAILISRTVAVANPTVASPQLGAGTLLAWAWMSWCAPLLAIPIAHAAPPPERAAPSWLGEHDEAVRLARRGDTAGAL